MSINLYPTKMENALPGLLFGTNEHVMLTRRAGEDIPFGAPLYADSSDGNVVLGKDTAGTLTFLGIAPFIQKTAGCYEKDEPISVMHRGYIYVKVAEAVKANGKVYANKADGAFKASDDSSNALEVPGAMYLEDGDANSIVPILIS